LKNQELALARIQREALFFEKHDRFVDENLGILNRVGQKGEIIREKHAGNTQPANHRTVSC
jgi:hypothetical protein